MEPTPMQLFMGPLLYVPTRWRYFGFVVALTRAIAIYQLSMYVPALYRAVGTGLSALTLPLFPEFMMLEDWLNSDPSIAPHIALAVVAFVDTIALSIAIYRRIARTRSSRHLGSP